jgi:ornithine carbamoyltransferase
MKKDLIRIQDLNKEDILHLFDLTDQAKQYTNRFRDALQRKNIGLIFQKPSNRTRVSFEVGIFQLGGNCIYLGPDEINLGVRESTADVSRTLSRYLNAIVARTHSHTDIMELTQNADIPVINGLSDIYHPCQGLTDIYSIKEKFPDFQNVTVGYIGDGNNVCHSLLLGCSKIGIHINIATPKGYEPSDDIVQMAKANAQESGARIAIGYSPQTAVKDVQVIYSDVWVSMGQEQTSDQKIRDFQGYQVNSELASLASDDYLFMHCLPAHRGLEVTPDVIDSPHSIIFDQAENRLHTQKSILMFLFE